MIQKPFFKIPLEWGVTNYQIYFQTPASLFMEGIVNLHTVIMLYNTIIISVVLLAIIIILINYRLSPLALKTYEDISIDEQLKTLGYIHPKSKFYKEYHMLYWVLFEDTFREQPKREVFFIHDYILEAVWLFVPSIILGLIAAPSFLLLYSEQTLDNPYMSVLVNGHQWYWTYEQPTFRESVSNLWGKDITWSKAPYSQFTSTSTLVGENSEEGATLMAQNRFIRLLTVAPNHELHLPVNSLIKANISSADVLHSWAIPSLGIKLDAVPGRINVVTFMVNRVGTFFGQCSELCGVDHGFMPIQMVVEEEPHFLNYCSQYAGDDERGIIFNPKFTPLHSYSK